MQPLRVQWQPYSGEARETEVDDPDEAVALFRAIDEDPTVGPVLVEYYIPEHESLSVGAGRELSVLNFQNSLDPPYFTSLGNAGNENLDFSYGGQFSEYPGKSAVPKAHAIVALREFVVSRTKPTSVEWEEL
jgi:hypothetical protein